MKPLFRAALAAASLLLAVNAHATVFSFSYTFGDSSTITGTLRGNAAGDYVNNISDLHVFFDGKAFSGLSFAGGYDPTTQQWGPAGSPSCRRTRHSTTSSLPTRIRTVQVS